MKASAPHRRTHILTLVASAAQRGDDSQRMSSVAVEALFGALSVTWTALLHDPGDGQLIFTASPSAPEEQHMLALFDKLETGKALGSRPLDVGTARSRGIDALDLCKAGAVVPLTDRGGGRGILVLGLGKGGTTPCPTDIETAELVAATLTPHLEAKTLTRENDRLKEMTIRSERLASIGGMTAGLAHEIRNPLVSIRTFTQLLPERYDDEEFRSSFLDLTLSEIDRICELVGELLDYSRPAGASEADTANVASCAEQTALLMATQAKSVGVELSWQSNLESVEAAIDPDRLKQTLMNVISNAITAAGAGGHVRVEVLGCKDGITIEVRDDGPGMSSAVAAKAFDPFFTTRAEGTGLGLAIVRGLVEKSGGRVELQTEEGKGCCVRIDLLPVSALLTESTAAETTAAKTKAEAEALSLEASPAVPLG
jgi:signal transduction histidine kinase